MRSLLARFDIYLQAAGGRQVVSFPFFVATLILSFLLHFIGSYGIIDTSTPVRIVAVFLAQVALTAVTALFYFVSSRVFSSKVSHRVVALTLPFGAFARAFTIQEILHSVEGYPLADNGFRLLSGTLLVTIMMFVFSIVIGLVTEHARESALLRADEQTLRELLTATRDRASTESNENANQIKKELLALLGSDLDLSSKQLSVHLRTVVDDGVRPLIQRILDTTPKQSFEPADLPPSKFKWSEVLGSLTFHKATNTTPLIIGVLSLIPWDVRYGNFAFAMQSAALKTITMFGALMIGRQIADRFLDRFHSRWNIVLIPPFLVTLTLPYVLLLVFWNPYGIGMLMAGQAIAFVSIVSTVYAFWGAVQTELDRIRNRRRINNDLIRWQIAYLNGLTWATKRNLARQLHGAVQSEIISVLLRIAKSEQENELSEADTAKLQRQLRDRLENILDAETEAYDFRAVLAEIVETWSAIAEIDFEIGQDAATAVVADPLAAETTIEIIREAVSNAIRHGQASEIRVRVSTISATDCILAEISSQGRRFEPSGREGMGTQQLRDCTVFYSVNDENGLTVVRAAIPYRSDVGEYITI